MSSSDALPIAGLFRRLGAMLYDVMLIVGLLFAYAACVLGIVNWQVGISDELNLGESLLFRLGAAATIIGFYTFFWLRGGQTLGMRAWRLKVAKADGSAMDLPSCMLRLATGTISLLVFGLGYFWCLIDHNNLTLHDRFSMTVVVVMPKPTTVY